MTNSPLISVIVPIYNVEEYIHQCVDSIIIQTYKNLEIILVNDGSPDNCGEICDDYALKDSRIKVIHKKNGGLSDARNAGLDIAKGEYIVFTDSDDFIHPQFVEILHTNIGDADMAFCDRLRYYENATEITRTDIITCPIEVFENDFLLKNFSTYRYSIVVVAWNKLYKSHIWDGLRYPVGKIHEDEFVIHHILDRCNKVVLCNKQMYYYRQRGDSIMGSVMSDSRFNNIIEYHEEREKFFMERKMYKEAKDTYNLKFKRYLMPAITNDSLILKKLLYSKIIYDRKLRLKLKIALILKKINSTFYTKLSKFRLDLLQK